MRCWIKEGLSLRTLFLSMNLSHPEESDFDHINYLRGYTNQVTLSIVHTVCKSDESWNLNPPPRTPSYFFSNKFSLFRLSTPWQLLILLKRISNQCFKRCTGFPLPGVHHCLPVDLVSFTKIWIIHSTQNFIFWDFIFLSSVKLHSGWRYNHITVFLFVIFVSTLSTL